MAKVIFAVDWKFFSLNCSIYALLNDEVNKNIAPLIYTEEVVTYPVGYMSPFGWFFFYLIRRGRIKLWVVWLCIILYDSHGPICTVTGPLPHYQWKKDEIILYWEMLDLVPEVGLGSTSSSFLRQVLARCIMCEPFSLSFLFNNLSRSFFFEQEDT